MSKRRHSHRRVASGDGHREPIPAFPKQVQDEILRCAAELNELGISPLGLLQDALVAEWYVRQRVRAKGTRVDGPLMMVPPALIPELLEEPRKRIPGYRGTPHEILDSPSLRDTISEMRKLRASDPTVEKLGVFAEEGKAGGRPILDRAGKALALRASRGRPPATRKLLEAEQDSAAYQESMAKGATQRQALAQILEQRKVGFSEGDEDIDHAERLRDRTRKRLKRKRRGT